MTRWKGGPPSTAPRFFALAPSHFGRPRIVESAGRTTSWTSPEEPRASVGSEGLFSSWPCSPYSCVDAVPTQMLASQQITWSLYLDICQRRDRTYDREIQNHGRSDTSHSLLASPSRGQARLEPWDGGGASYPSQTIGMKSRGKLASWNNSSRLVRTSWPRWGCATIAP